MNKNILIVDDEPSMLKLLQIILSKNYKVTIKNNGYNALTWLQDGNCPDLIIMDSEMPYLNAKNFIKSIKLSGLFSTIPVVLLSDAQNSDKEELNLMDQFDLIIDKPFNPLKLQNEISTLLSN